MVQENSYKKKEWSEGGEGGAAQGEDAQTSISFEKRSACIIEMVVWWIYTHRMMVCTATWNTSYSAKIACVFSLLFSSKAHFKVGEGGRGAHQSPFTGRLTYLTSLSLRLSRFLLEPISSNVWALILATQPPTLFLKSNSGWKRFARMTKWIPNTVSIATNPRKTNSASSSTWNPARF